MPYAEFPGDEIVNCHFKKPDDPGDGGPDGTHLCGEIGYDIPGGGWYVIYYDAPPTSASGEFRYTPAFIPYRINRDAIVVPSAGAPRDDQVWSTALPYYLTPLGVYFNPYSDPALDAAQGRTPLMVAAVAYEITWTYELRADPPPFPGMVPCTFLTGSGTGLGMVNAVTDPTFNVFKPNMPTAPNYGPAPVTYDVQKDGQGILTTMGFANHVTMCDDQEWLIANCPENTGCFNQTWSAESHFKIKALCAGPAPATPAPHRRAR